MTDRNDSLNLSALQAVSLPIGPTANGSDATPVSETAQLGLKETALSTANFLFFLQYISEHPELMTYGAKADGSECFSLSHGNRTPRKSEPK